ncbi:MAG: ABC transporter substrate-binding protein [Nitriliruptorales bacterium]|nr:ABC transporter substrate-binding protein [Nitriliruptorales bacterium]
MRTTLLAFCALLVACASGAGSEMSPAPAEPGVATAEAPLRIVSLSPTHTETLFALGAGDQVIAVDDQSNYPEGAPTTDLSGFQPNVEAIAGYEPDLVVLSDDIEDVSAGLQAVGVDTLLLEAPASLDDVYDQIARLGMAVGREEEAADLVASMRDEIDALVAEVPERAEPLRYYHELDDQLYTVTSGTFIGQVYALAGLESVADAADPGGQAGGYPQLSPEFLVEADPDLIFLADVKCCGQSAATVAERPGLSALTAVQQGRVIELDDDVASRWGPRVVDLLRAMVEATAAVPVG